MNHTTNELNEQVNQLTNKNDKKLSQNRVAQHP